SLASRLLAAQPVPERLLTAAAATFDLGETAATLFVRGLSRRDTHRPKTDDRVCRPGHANSQTREFGNQLLHLCSTVGLAHQACSFLSLRGGQCFGPRSRACCGLPGRDDRRDFFPSAPLSLPFGRLGLVSHFPRPGDRTRADRFAGPRGSLHLSSPN